LVWQKSPLKLLYFVAGLSGKPGSGFRVFYVFLDMQGINKKKNDHYERQEE
jgi:hypothetical protein